MDESDDEMRRALEALTERVSCLESAAVCRVREEQPGHEGGQHRSVHPERSEASAVDEEQYWALTGLRSRLGDHPATAEGAVMLIGSMTLPGGAPVAWQQSAGTTGMLETDWSDRAAEFAALGHPVRLELLRHLLSGVHATAELAEVAALGTTGQLHHHLRQLVAAGWVRQSGRGSYEVPAARVVPLLASLAGAQR